MKDLRYTQVYTNMLTKQPIKEGDTPITLQHLLYNVATAADPSETLPIDKKMKLFSMARKIADTKPLKSAELTMLRERAGKYLSTPAFGFVSEEISLALEETPEEDKE